MREHGEYCRYPSVRGVQIGELLRPDAFAHPVTQLELRETHISWVILTGAFAYKIKKPVKLDFIDATSLERRRRYCQEELRLNRRLAPELYVDVVAITRARSRVLVVDAAFLDAAYREPFRNLAQRLRAFCIIVSCQADPATLAARIVERRRERHDPSDADLAVLDAQLRMIEPFAASERPHVVIVDTAEPNAVQQVVAAIRALSVA